MIRRSNNHVSKKRYTQHENTYQSRANLSRGINSSSECIPSKGNYFLHQNAFHQRGILEDLRESDCPVERFFETLA